MVARCSKIIKACKIPFPFLFPPYLALQLTSPSLLPSSLPHPPADPSQSAIASASATAAAGGAGAPPRLNPQDGAGGGAAEGDKYVISIKQHAKFVVGLGERVAPTDVEEGMRVG